LPFPQYTDGVNTLTGRVGHLLEQPRDTNLAKTCQSRLGNWKLFTVLTRGRYWFLCRDGWIHCATQQFITL